LWVFHKRKKDERRDTKIVSPYMYCTVRRRKEELMERKGTRELFEGMQSIRIGWKCMRKGHEERN
jgi:hypothetical protein